MGLAWLGPFSATPAVQVRPTVEGLEVLARYITRAHERHDARARLYHEIVGLLHRKPSATT